MKHRLPFLRDITRPKEPVSRRVALLALWSTVATFFGVWSLLTYGGYVGGIFLPKPHKVLVELFNLFIHEGFLLDVWISTSVVVTGFLIASAAAIPLGMLMGSYKIVFAMADIPVNFVRYIPVSGLIPLLILWFGIDYAQKVAVIAIGTFFLEVLMIADTSAAITKEIVDTSYTLGANRLTVLTKVLIPAALPGVVDNLRIGMSGAWTYLVIAELVAADHGIGYRILNAMRGLKVAEIFAGLLTIGLLGVLFAKLFKLILTWGFPWYEQAEAR